MKSEFRDLIKRLDGLSIQIGELNNGIRQAINIAEVDPDMSLTRTRKVLEYVVRQVYESRVGEPAGTRPLEALIQRIVKDGHIPRRIAAYASTVRELGNVGTHDFRGGMTSADVLRSLTLLIQIVEWYFQEEAVTTAPASASAASTPGSPLAVPSDATHAGAASRGTRQWGLSRRMLISLTGAGVLVLGVFLFLGLWIAGALQTWRVGIPGGLPPDTAVAQKPDDNPAHEHEQGSPVTPPTELLPAAAAETPPSSVSSVFFDGFPPVPSRNELDALRSIADQRLSAAPEDRFRDAQAERISIEYPPAGSKPVNVGRQLPELAHLKGHTGTVRCLAFSSDGTTLATGSDDQTVRLWDVRTWQLRATLRGKKGSVRCVAFSPDGTLLAFGGDSGYQLGIKVWNLAESREQAVPRSNMRVTSPLSTHALAFSPNNKTLAAGGSGPVFVWDVDTGKELYAFPWQETFPSYVYGVAFSPDGQTLAAGCHGGGNMVQNDSVRLWSMQTGQKGEVLIGEGGTFGLSHDDIHGAVSYSPDGKTLARVTKFEPDFGRERGNPTESGGSVIVWKLAPDIEKIPHPGPGGSVFALGLSSQGSVLVASAGISSRLGFVRPNPNQAMQVQLWDVSKERKTIVETQHLGAVVALAFSPDRKYLASGSEDTTVKVWDVNNALASPPSP